MNGAPPTLSVDASLRAAEWAAQYHPVEFAELVYRFGFATRPEPGKTLRDEFAMRAPVPPATWWGCGGRPTCDGHALWNYQYADAMMAKRREPKQ